MIRRAISLRSASVIALSVVACGTDVTGLTQGVVLLTDAREYQLPPPGQPPTSILGTISNQTFAGVPVRRCLIRGSAVDPVGVDLVFEKAQSDGTWQAVNLGFNCLSSAAPRADAVLAPHEVALVARIVVTVPGQYRLRLGYGTMQLTGDGVWGEPKDRDECIRVLRRAVELGVDFIDTAAGYGNGRSERLNREQMNCI